ncbi:MAG: hypothetical protein MJ072_06925, partial [Clostridia bacterium]|nr:hypothetical protein [Clostridia bacterium]
MAEKLGYRLVNLTLLPYGAVIKGDLKGLNLTDEIKIVLLGPLVNLLLGALTVSLWWLFPD